MQRIFFLFLFFNLFFSLTCENLLNDTLKEITEKEYSTFVVTSDPSTDSDSIASIAIDSNYIYAAGNDSSPGNNYQLRIEKRDIVTGGLVVDFGDNGVIQNNPSSGNDRFYDLAVDSDYIYLAGYDSFPGYQRWRIEKRDIVTGALDTNFDSDGIIEVDQGSNDCTAYAIFLYTNYIFIIGSCSTSPSDSQWRIEKRSKSTGALDTGFDIDGIVQIDPSSENDETGRGIFINDEELWYAGIDKGGTNDRLRIDKRRSDDGSVDNSFGASGIVYSDMGISPLYVEGMNIVKDLENIYISVATKNTKDWYLEKRDDDSGQLDAAFGDNGILKVNQSIEDVMLTSIALSGNYLYLAGGVINTAGEYEGRIEMRDKIKGDLAPGFGSDGGVVSKSGPFFYFTDIAVDSTYIYAAASEAPVDISDSRWRIEKRRKDTGGF